MAETKPIKLYTLKEAADILRISYGVLLNMCKAGEIGHSRVRWKYVISDQQILEYLEEKEDVTDGLPEVP